MTAETARTHADVIETDVIVLGCGPAGLSAATLLAGEGVSVAAVDKHRIVVSYPRATHIDDEVVRLFQALGVADAMAPELTESGDFTLYDGDWQPIMEVKLPEGAHRSRPTEQGWKRDYMFQQPDFESRLRGKLAAHPRCTTWFGWEAAEVTPDKHGVTVRLESRDKLGARTLRGRWLIAADGARSSVRHQMGAAVLDLNGTQRSLIIDIFPFRHDHVLRERSSFIHCAPHENPLTYVRTAAPRCRFELMLRQRDETAPFLDDRLHRQILSRWFAPDEYRIERADVYQWRSLLVQGWRHGRMLLMGDAAHEMAPMLGQGLGSGLRDAANLAWKLARVVRGDSPDTLLDSYESERAPHVRRYIETAAHIANQAEWWADNPPSAAQADATESIEKFRPRLGPGLHVGDQALSGTLAPQPRLGDGRLLDDHVGYAFALIALPSLPPRERDLWQRLGVCVIAEEGESTDWLRAKELSAALIRPDRYIFGTAETDEGTTALGTRFARALGVEIPLPIEA